MTEDETELDRIITECTETLDHSPGDAVALIRRGRAWCGKKDYDRAIADYDEAIIRDPGRADARYNRGLAFSRKDQHDLAIAEFSEAISLSVVPKQLAYSYCNRGRSRSLVGHHSDALVDLNEAIRINPQDGRTYGIRGFAWQNLGSHNKAIADFNEAIRNGQDLADKDLADVYHNRGNSLVQLGKYRRAIADFTRAIRLDPDPRSYNSRGVAWSRKGRYANTIADYQSALDRDRESSTRRMILGAVLAGCPDRRYRDGARAIELMTEACELTDYRDASCLSFLAAAYAEQGDVQSAVTHQKNAQACATDSDDEEGMVGCLKLYEAGQPWRMESPKWWQCVFS